MADKNEKDAAQSAIYRAIAEQLNGGSVGPQGIHHLAEAYALVTTPGRSSSGAAAIPKT